jgi:hypothetical protein
MNFSVFSMDISETIVFCVLYNVQKCPSNLLLVGMLPAEIYEI